MPARTRPQCRQCHKALDPIKAVAGDGPGMQNPARPLCDDCTQDARTAVLFNDRRRIEAAYSAGRVIW